MKVDFKDVIFTTYEQGVEQTLKKRTLNGINLFFIIIAVTSLTLILGNISVYLGIFFPFVLLTFLRIYTSQKGRMQLNNFKPNGKLIINHEGFVIDQTEKILIPYGSLKKVNYEFDRGDPLYNGKFPKARTYKLIFQTDRGLTTIYVDNQAELGSRKLYGNIVETLQALRKTNHELYKKIQSDA